MPTSSAALSFAALAFILIAVPGPSVMFVIGRGIVLGRRGALETVAGNAVGIYVQVAFVATGLGVVIEQSAAAYSALKFVGAIYLVWLGTQAIRHRSKVAGLDDAPRLQRAPWLDGLIVGIANPKSIVFFAALLPQFVEPSGAPAGVQMMALGLIFVAIALVLDSMWGLAAGTARAWFTEQPHRQGRMNVMSGVTMIGLGALLATTRRAE